MVLSLSNVLREIVRLQIESRRDERAIDSVDGFDSPVCAARVLMGMAQGLSARKHAGAKAGASKVPGP